VKKTFLKLIILFVILLAIVLGFFLAPRFVPIVGEILFTNEDADVISVDPEEELKPVESEYERQESEQRHPSWPSEEDEDIDIPEDDEIEYPSLVPEAQVYYENDDIVAHIVIPGTAIDYLIAHTDNNSFYLYHDLRGNRTSAGTVFLDYLNSPDFSDPNSIIYGHNMRNGTKFHDLRMYRSRDFFEENNSMIVTTKYDVLYYDIFTVFITHINFNYIQIEFEDDEFLEMADKMKMISYHQTEIEVGEDDRILVLSTCWGPVGTNYRLVIVGRLRQEEKQLY